MRSFICINTLDLQNVNITLRILFRPKPDQLPHIYTILGVDYDERVLPSITTEVLKAVVVSILLYYFFINSKSRINSYKRENVCYNRPSSMLEN